MAIFGRITARQRLRRATRESLAVPAFSSPIDCTPWVTGGLWPAELATTDAETATLAEYLRADLDRIARSANDELKLIKRAGLPDLARQADEARIIDEARARAVRRVESTIRQLQTLKAEASTHRPGAGVAEAAIETDLGMTQVIPIVREAERGRHHAEPVAGEDEDPRVAVTTPCIDDTQVIPALTEVEPGPVGARDEPEAVARHRADDAAAVPAPPTRNATAGAESDIDRLHRLLEFVVRQESRLHWAVADYPDGTTVVVTDLAHGWIPPGIALPAGVRLLAPARRSGKVPALIGESTRAVTYAPGGSLRRSADIATTKSSPHPPELPTIDDLGGSLSAATHGRDGLPRMVHAMASAAAAGIRIVDQEVDVLRVHVDTARYQLLIRYPNVDSALLLNCLLLAATEAFVIGDSVSANYHLAWFRELAAPPSS
ncbi:MAG: DUF5631 domain-containing protein [Mycobacterium sp.]|uniref:DUF5631 domain-containing protein n=1 Tax=Mycobacterium sp. TaxID=1785 RepID=UPI003F999531